MESQLSMNMSLGYTAFFIGMGATLLVCRVMRRRGNQPAVAADDESEQVLKSETAVAQLRDVAHNMACDVNAHRLLVEGVSARLGASMTGDTKDEKLILDATVELLDANLELQCRLADAEQQIQQQQQEIFIRQQEAETDPLTRLPNRRAFDAGLAEAVAELSVTNQPYSVLMLDVDYFKQFNDAHGHVAGDEVLRHLGQKLPQLIKSTDVACRYGGEEFALILRGARLLEAQSAAQRIRQAIEAMPVDVEGCTLSVTASIGVAEGVRGEEGRKAIARADECVYASKRAGRNCCHWHNGSHCVHAAPLKHQAAHRVSRTRRRSLQPVEQHIPAGAPVISDRAVLVSLLQRRVAESARSHEPLSVVQLAVRQEGRSSGGKRKGEADQVESAIADAIAAALRDMDYLGRWGQDEFTIILPRCTEHAAKLVAQRLVTVVKSAMHAPSTAAGVSFCIGIAELIHPMSAEQLIELALKDQAASAVASGK
jgi:diguanylate cyclase